LTGLLLLAVILLGAGSKILSSIVFVVLSLRGGNPIPFAAAILVPLGVITCAGRISDDRNVKSMATLVGYATGAYMLATVFLTILPMGLSISLFATAVMGAISALLYDPSQINRHNAHISQALVQRRLGSQHAQANRPALISGVASEWTTLVIEQTKRKGILEMLQERPLLKVSYTVFEDCDILIVHTVDMAELSKVRMCLREYGIEAREYASNLFNEIVCALPLVEQNHGIPLSSYRVSQSETTLQAVLRRPRVRTTFFPHKNGLVVILPEVAMPGLKMEAIPDGQHISFVVGRDVAPLLCGDDSSASKA
jgi:hypothetical protein